MECADSIEKPQPERQSVLRCPATWSPVLSRPFAWVVGMRVQELAGPSRLWRCLICALLVLVAAMTVLAGEDAVGKVTITVFRSPNCPHCDLVELKALTKLGKRIGVVVEVRNFDVDEKTQYELLLQVERELADYDNEFPTVVVGNHILGGNKEIEKGLERAIVDGLSSGGLQLPRIITDSEPHRTADPKPLGGKPVYAAFFSQSGCSNCNRLVAALKHLKTTSRSFDYRLYDLREGENARLFEAVCEKAGVPAGRRRENPAVFVGDQYLLGDDATETKVREKILACLETGTGIPWDVEKEALSKAQHRILKRFRDLGPWAVVLAGLVDGINPCAFATIVFFVAYLTATGHTRRDTLVVGLTFSAAVFLTYFLVGLGTLGVLVKLRAYSVAAKVVDVVAAFMAIALAAISFADFIKARRNRAEEMRLVLPKFLKKRINLSISKQMRMRSFIVGAVVAGFLVSLFELACTGQVYFPTLALISGDVGLRMKAWAFLSIYNLMFVLPLLAILGMVGLGLSSQALTAFFRRNIALSKLALAALFLAIGGVVLLNILRNWA